MFLRLNKKKFTNNIISKCGSFTKKYSAFFFVLKKDDISVIFYDLDKKHTESSVPHSFLYSA